jgi:MFS transporter, NNP family, nitrate/nitrite transporter
MSFVVGSILMPIFTAMCGGDTSKAWRSVSVVPAATALISGIAIYYTSDDAPKGNYQDLKEHGQFPPVTVASSSVRGFMNLNNWIMFVQYACCLGVELTMNSASAMYFKDAFGLSTEASLAIAGIFGWLNLFARGLGGVVSDLSFSRWGMRGRLWAQTLSLIAQGVMVFAFAKSNTLGGSIVALVVFSLFNKTAQGTSFAIVPYIDPCHMGMAYG